MRGDAFETSLHGIRYTAEEPTIREGVRCTLTATNAAGEVMATDRLNLDRQADRNKFAQRMAGEEPPADDTANHKAWAIRIKDYAQDLWTVRETLVDVLAPGVPADSAQRGWEPSQQDLADGLALLDQPDVLVQAGETVQALGYAGNDTTHPRLLVLVHVSRSLERPTNCVVTGPSSSGKSHLVGLVTKLFPEDAVYTLAGMSERVLAYSDADLRHRHIIIGEASALHREGIGASLLRTLAWEGNLRYEVVEKNEAGQQVTRVIEREGPTGFITTTTGRVEPELETRVLSVYVDDTPAGTRIILNAAGARAEGDAPEPPILERWWAAFWWLQGKGESRVVIPFATLLAERYPDKLVRARRDFVQLLNLIRAASILHQRRRQHDQDGRIIATIDDYRAVYEVAAQIFGAIASEGLTQAIRDFVAAVAALTPESGDTATIAALAKELGIDRAAVRKRAQRALAGGWVVNVQEKERQAMLLRLGADMPIDAPALPDPDELEALLHTDVPRSHAADSPDADAENSGTNANVSPLSHAPTSPPAWERGTNVGQGQMSNGSADVEAKNGLRGSVGQQLPRTRPMQQTGRNDDVLGHIEWSSGNRSCQVCKGVTWWRLAESTGMFQCVTCHPPTNVGAAV